MLKRIYFSCQINLTIGERPNKKNIESLNLTRKVYRMVQKKIYDRVCSQLINWFFMLYSFSLYIYGQFFFCKHVFKTNRKKVTVIWILVWAVRLIIWTEIIRRIKMIKRSRQEWMSKYICNYFINYLNNSFKIKCIFFISHLKKKKNYVSFLIGWHFLNKTFSGFLEPHNLFST